ncbi:MAG: DUF2065 domain-containing protein [Dongiaceae bacterium]
MLQQISIALALVFVIEGLIYALFPAQMKAMLIRLQEWSPESLRSAGLIAALLGLGMIYIIRLQG